MATRAAINDLRSADLRELNAMVAAVRARIAALERSDGAAAAASTTSSTSSSTSSAAAFLRSLNSERNGLLAKVATNQVRARSMEADAPFQFEDADGVGGNPRLTAIAQAASQVFASPMGYSGAPAFRTLELASPDFAGQGQLGTVLHGNEYGEPYWAAVEDIFGAAAKVSPVAVPASATSAGEEGQMAWNSTHLYLCLGPYTWRRVALSTF